MNFPSAKVLLEPAEVLLKVAFLVLDEHRRALRECFRLKALVPVMGEEEGHGIPERCAIAFPSQEFLQFRVCLDVLIERVQRKRVGPVGVQLRELPVEEFIGGLKGSEAVPALLPGEEKVRPEFSLPPLLDAPGSAVALKDEGEADTPLGSWFNHIPFMHCMHKITSRDRA
jgi:hypothetical protein